MNTTKPTLSSKTVLMNLFLAILGALVFFNVLPANSLDPQVVGVVGIVGNLLAAYFRKTAVARLT